MSRPSRARITARFVATVVFPDPPLIPPTTTIISKEYHLDIDLISKTERCLGRRQRNNAWIRLSPCFLPSPTRKAGKRAHGRISRLNGPLVRFQGVAGRLVSPLPCSRPARQRGPFCVGFINHPPRRVPFHWKGFVFGFSAQLRLHLFFPYCPCFIGCDAIGGATCFFQRA